MALFKLNNQSLPADPLSYSIPATIPPCSGNNQICTINATDDGSGYPELNLSVLSEMVTALNTRTSTTNVKLKA
ncbi:hypothetical protein ACFX5U_16070 [Sphingobacterium sp. SG20118]|uniref:hypothetical protein n=1 Tax=Sphingobacterium sp. SG20118 TaxID=3367156 RepID=UPI0037DFC698